MNKILIEKKYNKQLNIFLGIYITLCLIFALLFNGFFVKPKAYSYNNNLPSHTWTLSWIQKNNKSSGSTTGYINYTPDNNSRGVFVKIGDIDNCVDAYLGGNYTEPLYVFMCEGNSVLESKTTNMGGVTYDPGLINMLNSGGSTYKNYMESIGFNNKDGSDDNDIPKCYYMCGKDLNWAITTFHLDDVSNLQYIDNVNDLKSFFLDNNENVVKIGDPDNPTLPEDDSLPVPQKLGTDIQNDNVGTPPFISGSWENPGSIYASFDASEVQVEIQYKPVFQLYKKMFNIKLAKVSSSEWLPVTKTQISNNTINRFILYNAYSGYPKPFDSQTLHSGSLTDDIKNIGNSSGYTDMFNPISGRIANGTNWRIRYVVDNKTSLWVVFHVNSVGSLKNEESVSFENASGDPVSADDVNYTNSPQTSTVDKLNVNNFFDSLSNAINGIFNTTNNSFTAQDTEGSKGFYAMFKATFEKFPVFWTFFCLGLIVAILLRILGR